MSVRDANFTSDKNNYPDVRGQAVLSAIIGEHLITGEPVGSKIIAEKFANAYGLSSATIRNVMGELENAGLLEQPHTSAGRVPTDKGYRFYVNNLVEGQETLTERRVERALAARVGHGGLPEAVRGGRVGGKIRNSNSECRISSLSKISNFKSEIAESKCRTSTTLPKISRPCSPPLVRGASTNFSMSFPLNID